MGQTIEVSKFHTCNNAAFDKNVIARVVAQSCRPQQSLLQQVAVKLNGRKCYVVSPHPESIGKQAQQLRNQDFNFYFPSLPFLTLSSSPFDIFPLLCPSPLPFVLTFLHFLLLLGGPSFHQFTPQFCKPNYGVAGECCKLPERFWCFLRLNVAFWHKFCCRFCQLIIKMY